VNYFEVYDKLYEAGYRSKLKFTGGLFARALTATLQYKTILDVGCSRGEGVQWFVSQHKRAIGIDPAELAVKDAKSRGLECQVGSACNIPFEEGVFDLVFSSDVIEHLESGEDVDKAINEMIRVSKKYIALQIAIHPTKHQWRDVVDIDNIHSFLRPRDWWYDYFLEMPGINVRFFGFMKHHVIIVLEKGSCLKSRL
jgi:ubiquinone/menaquinone biosynthesis C-methylase UbiE